MNVGSVFLDKVLMSQAVSDDKAVQTKQAAPSMNKRLRETLSFRLREP